jgi:hypothetical protein
VRASSFSWLRGAGILALTFAAGAAAGVGYDRHVSPALHAPTMDAASVVQHIRLALGLDSTQTAAITRILAHHQHAVDSSWRAMQPDVRANLDSTLREIMGVLKPEQVGKFREMVHAMHPGMLP